MTVFAGYDTDEEISFDIIGNLCRVRQAQVSPPNIQTNLHEFTQGI